MPISGHLASQIGRMALLRRSGNARGRRVDLDQLMGRTARPPY
jgi:hypothetical protein